MRCVLVLSALLISACQPDLGLTRSVPQSVRQQLSSARSDFAAHPEDVEVSLKLADALLQAGELFEAADLLQRVIEQAPQNPTARAMLTQAYVGLGYFMPAFSQLRACLESTPSDPDCLLHMGGLMRSEGSKIALAEARRVFRRFLEVAPNHPRAAEVRAGLAGLDAELGPEAETATGPGSQPASQPAAGGASQPSGLVPGHEQAGAGEEVGELNEFGKAFAEALAKSRQNDAIGAEAAYRRALAIRPNDPSALAGLAETLYVQKQTEEALTSAARGYELDPSQAQTRWIYGRILIETGKDPKKGVEIWRSLRQEFPEIAKRLGIDKTLSQIERFAPPPATP